MLFPLLRLGLDQMPDLSYSSDRGHVKRAVQYLSRRSLEDFPADGLVQSAVIRCVEVIGEAARMVSDEIRQRAIEISWPLIVGMRPVLAHNYGAVNLEKVYAVVKEHLPELVKNLKNLIRLLGDETHWRDENEPPGITS
jgi:uncharacterized protein with HEPN domain